MRTATKTNIFKETTSTQDKGLVETEGLNKKAHNEITKLMNNTHLTRMKQ